MAKVTKSERSAWIDDFLDYEFDQWCSVPELAAEWKEWDAFSQTTLVVNWGVVTDRLASLRGWAADGQMTPAQRQRFEELERVVAQHEPTVKRLFGE